jgi:hypothetical protein
LWDEEGNLIQHKIYKDGVVVKDFLIDFSFLI